MKLLFALVLAAAALPRYDASRLAPMLSEVVRFATYEGNTEAHDAQKAWLLQTAKTLGLDARDAGKVTEIELPATEPNAPVLGLIVHGDVQPVEADAWGFSPFEGRIEDGYVWGRGSADDKGPLVQALIAMQAIKDSGMKRTHTIRLLVGSTEESDSSEMGEYLKTHQPPDYSLVLDSAFPVVVGEKAWNALAVSEKIGERGPIKTPYTVSAMNAGLSASIVPDHAEVTLLWREGAPKWEPLEAKLKTVKLPEGTRLVTGAQAERMRVIVYGKSAHAGVNLEGGRNALVGLARALEGKLPTGGADDLLSFVRMAGKDHYGTGLGILDNDPVWGHYAVNIATIKPVESDEESATLTINLRRIPPRTGAQLKEHLQKVVSDFNARTGAQLQFGAGYYDDEPLGFDPNAKIVKRLLADYTAATGKREKPAISGGGTYAKRLPNAIAFGMWFPDKPYPGHDVNEKMPIADLERGEKVLLQTLVDFLSGPKMEEPFKP